MDVLGLVVEDRRAVLPVQQASLPMAFSSRDS
jgi:hypothetical protein